MIAMPAMAVVKKTFAVPALDLWLDEVVDCGKGDD